jgi:hypothetical protein
MSRRLFLTNKLEKLLQPETALERALLAVPVFRDGLLWGEPRFGHPEGVVAYHVKEVLNNIALIPHLSTADRSSLRLIALAHDAFKYAEDRSRPRDLTKHHGVLARRFMESYTSNGDVLDILETHDEAYYHWLYRHQAPSVRPLTSLLDRVGHCKQLYYLFFKCDTQTGDKTQAPLRWFEQTVMGGDVVVFKPFWPWEKV